MNDVTVIATQKLDDKDKQVGIFFDRNRLRGEHEVRPYAPPNVGANLVFAPVPKSCGSTARGILLSVVFLFFVHAFHATISIRCWFAIAIDLVRLFR
ncbi:MAG: hypothetical protein BECKG1743E_GA0114224_100235 [Candidatus Kentron sp. G]|nr:MAG: hypothetical protein BECKG1743E_GA0114224_100235 [Candidatus Kentron sp. G]